MALNCPNSDDNCETSSKFAASNVTPKDEQSYVNYSNEIRKEADDKTEMNSVTNNARGIVIRGIDVAKYIVQKQYWPKEGKHILAQYDDNTVIVYQAFKPSIARYAVENQKFGGPEFSYERMSWIKTNFLWMTYRCGWASKKNQERVLAVRMSRYGFEVVLANAYTAALQKEENLQTNDINVRLQWDPDHSPTYEKVSRRAIQLGLKGKILKTYGTEWICSITDITDFVKSQKKILDKEGDKELVTPKERVYQVRDYKTSSRIELDEYDADENLDGDRQLAKVQFLQPNSNSKGNGYGIQNPSSSGWTCEVSECANINITARKRCSRCNTPRSDIAKKYSTESDSIEPCGAVGSCDDISGSPMCRDDYNIGKDISGSPMCGDNNNMGKNV